jgi:magnesium-transporting ATPase (P-type)
VLLDKPELVFARASPQDKLTIVKHLRARDEVGYNYNNFI